MRKASISLQDLRRRIDAKAQAEPSWRFWGLFVHVCKRETLRAAYHLAKENDGAPGSDGVTFEAIEAAGVESFLDQLRNARVHGTYRPRQLLNVGYNCYNVPLEGASTEKMRPSLWKRWQRSDPPSG